MATISYSYTHYRFNKKFTEPLPLEQFNLIKKDRDGFEKNVKAAIKSEYYKNNDGHELSAIFFKISAGLIGICGLLGLSYITFVDSLSANQKDNLESTMIGCFLMLGFTMIGSLSYWRSRRQFKIATNSITRYYSIHTDLAFEAPDYNKYLASVEDKREYFETVGRQRAFYENQQM